MLGRAFDVFKVGDVIRLHGPRWVEPLRAREPRALVTESSERGFRVRLLDDSDGEYYAGRELSWPSYTNADGMRRVAPEIKNNKEES